MTQADKFQSKLLRVKTSQVALIHTHFFSSSFVSTSNINLNFIIYHYKLLKLAWANSIQPSESNEQVFVHCSNNISLTNKFLIKLLQII